MYLKNLDTRYRSLNEEARSLESYFTKVGLIRGYLSNRGYSLETLAELYSVIPLDLEINHIRFDNGGDFSLKGTAASMSTVFSFVGSMEESKYFKEVKTKHTTKRKEGAKDVTDFEIRCLIAKGVN